MALSGDLISQFVKVTNDKKNEKKETTVYGTTIEYGGQRYVKLDGSDILTPATTTVALGDNNRVTVMIKNHEAVITGNMSSPAARVEDLDDVGSTVTNLDILLANKVDTLEFNAEVARIDTLVSDNVTIKRKLLASEAEIDAIQADTVVINEKLTANEAEINALKTGKLDASVAKITYATITALEAVDADIHNLEATYSDINTLIFGSASGTTIHTSFSNSVIAQLGDAQIKSAMIESLSASKITAGDIITNNVRVKSADGSLIISDETMQISDGAQVRVQIGKDASNDYSINVWDADGKLMFSKGGITDSAIKQAIIRNDMVSATANISATKLDINSLFTEINKSTKFIKSSRVYLDDKGQVLDVAFNTLTTTVEEQGETISSQGTAISVIQGQISSKIWQQDIDAVSGGMSTQFSTLTQKVDGISATVSDHTTLISKKADSTTVTAVTDRVSTLETGLEGFKSTVSGTYATKAEVDALETKVSAAETKIEQTTQALTLTATKTEVTTAKSEAISEANSNTATLLKNYSTTSAMNAAIELKAGSITNTVSSTYATKTALSTLEQTADGLALRLDSIRVGGENLFNNSESERTTNRFLSIDSKDILQDYIGREIAISFDMKLGEGGVSRAIQVYPYQNNGVSIKDTATFTPTTEWQRFSFKTTVKDWGVNNATYTTGSIAWYDYAGANSYSVRKIKIELGNMASDWCPSISDVANGITNAGKTATNFLNFSSSGLVVGDHTAGTLGKNVLIDSEAVKVRTGATVNAIFGADIIELAKSNESATISMLNGAFKIYYDNTIEDGGFGIYGRTTDGQMRLAFQPVNENNNLTIGWGGYSAKANSTNLYGHKMHLTTNEDIILDPGSGNVQMDGNILLTNGKNIFGKNTGGEMRSMAILNASNQMLFGYGSYVNNEGVVYYDGNDVSVRSKKDIHLISSTDVILDPGSGSVKVIGNVILPNGRSLYGFNTGGTARSIATLNASNQTIFGYGSYANSEGSVFYEGNNITICSKNDITFQTEHESVVLQDGDGNATYNAFFRPASNAKCTLGTNANRWYAVYASNATIQTSDIREKENIVSLSDVHSNLFDRLQPVQYNFINGNGRICYGLIAQDVIDAMTELGIGEHDLDLVHHDQGTDETDDTYGLAYANLIALLIHEVQKLKREIVTIKGGIQNGR